MLNGLVAMRANWFTSLPTRERCVAVSNVVLGKIQMVLTYSGSWGVLVPSVDSWIIKVGSNLRLSMPLGSFDLLNNSCHLKLRVKTWQEKKKWFLDKAVFQINPKFRVWITIYFMHLITSSVFKETKLWQLEKKFCWLLHRNILCSLIKRCPNKFSWLLKQIQKCIT